METPHLDRYNKEGNGIKKGITLILPHLNISEEKPGEIARTLRLVLTSTTSPVGLYMPHLLTIRDVIRDKRDDILQLLVELPCISKEGDKK